MKTPLLTIAFVFAAAAGFPDGSGEAVSTDSGEIVVPADMETISDFDPDLDFAQVIQVDARLETAGTWHFSVTVRHRDEGWAHYADLWEVVDPESSLVYGQRILAHPHDTEQPFTRTQSGISIPDGINHLLVRAKCTKHGFSGKAVLVDLTAAEGDGFKVAR